MNRRDWLTNVAALLGATALVRVLSSEPPEWKPGNGWLVTQELVDDDVAPLCTDQFCDLYDTRHANYHQRFFRG
jgi:hypothetical protein